MNTQVDFQTDRKVDSARPNRLRRPARDSSLSIECSSLTQRQWQKVVSMQCLAQSLSFKSSSVGEEEESDIEDGKNRDNVVEKKTPLHSLVEPPFSTLAHGIHTCCAHYTQQVRWTVQRRQRDRVRGTTVPSAVSQGAQSRRHAGCGLLPNRSCWQSEEKSKRKDERDGTG